MGYNWIVSLENLPVELIGYTFTEAETASTLETDEIKKFCNRGTDYWQKHLFGPVIKTWQRLNGVLT